MPLGDPIDLVHQFVVLAVEAQHQPGILLCETFQFHLEYPVTHDHLAPIIALRLLPAEYYELDVGKGGFQRFTDEHGYSG